MHICIGMQIIVFIIVYPLINYYRLDKIEEPLIYQFEDSADIFEREPYGIFVNPREIGNLIIRY